MLISFSNHFSSVCWTDYVLVMGSPTLFNLANTKFVCWESIFYLGFSEWITCPNLPLLSKLYLFFDATSLDNFFKLWELIRFYSVKALFLFIYYY